MCCLLPSLFRHCPDLLEDSHEVEVLMQLLDLTALDRDHLCARCVKRLAGLGKCLAWAHKRPGLGPHPGHLYQYQIAAGEGIRDRSLAIVGESLLPPLVGLDHLLSSLEAPLAAHLMVNHIWGQYRLEALPITGVIGFHVLTSYPYRV